MCVSICILLFSLSFFGSMICLMFINIIMFIMKTNVTPNVTPKRWAIVEAHGRKLKTRYNKKRNSSVRISALTCTNVHGRVVH